MKKFLICSLIGIQLFNYSGFNISKNLNNYIENDINTMASTEKTNELNWYFQIRNDGLPPKAAKESKNFISNYNTYYLGDTSSKVLYLTFDEGYENGFTSKILDILKDNDVKASFFVVKPYIKQNPDLIKRMVDEGHLVCNHSSTHPSMASITDKGRFKKEFYDVEEEYKKLTNQDIPKFFRPPMGKYSEASLKQTNDLGYKTIFWSFAYHDWDVKNQPEKTKAKEIILKRTHNGAIVLLHAVSKTNTEILDDVIKEWKNNGYEVKPLTDLPEASNFLYD